jgi:ABC-type branched-subunit amino acid transport system ATPase component
MPVRHRALAGIVATLQSTSVFGDSTVLQNAVVGAGLRRRYGGAFARSSRRRGTGAESAELRATARRALGLVGLECRG